jgi:hypothetical protein
MARQMTWTPQHEQELLRDFEERYVVGKWTSYANRQYGKMKNKTELEQQLGLDPRKKTAVVFPHILWDSTLFWGEDLFDDYEDWFVETVRAARDNCAVNWVVKLHPGNVWKLKRDRIVGESIDRRVLREKIGELPAHIHLLEPDTDISTFALFDVMDYCLTVRGTVGIEAAAFGIPVFTGGTGRYSGCGFTVDSTTRAEFLSKLAHIQDIPRLTPTQTEMAKKYAFALFIARPARFQSFHPEYKSLDELGHPLDHNVRINVRSAEEFARAADLQEFARWVESGQADFLSEGFL